MLTLPLPDLDSWCRLFASPSIPVLRRTKRQLDLLTQLPFGITVHNHIACVPLDSQHTRVSFG